MFCRLHKFIISNSLDNDKPLWPVTQRHIDRCPDCAGFRNLCRTMDLRLKSDNTLIDEALIEILPEQILDNAVSNSERLKPQPIPIRPILAAAAAIALIAFPVVAFLLHRSYLSRPKDNRYDLAVNSVRDIYSSGSVLAGKLTGNQTPFASIVKKPLQSEIKNLTADTQSALRFLIASVDVTTPTAQLPD